MYNVYGSQTEFVEHVTGVFILRMRSLGQKSPSTTVHRICGSENCLGCLTVNIRAGTGVFLLMLIIDSRLGRWRSRAPTKNNLYIGKQLKTLFMMSQSVARRLVAPRCIQNTPPLTV